MGILRRRISSLFLGGTLLVLCLVLNGWIAPIQASSSPHLILGVKTSYVSSNTQLRPGGFLEINVPLHTTKRWHTTLSGQAFGKFADHYQFTSGLLTDFGSRVVLNSSLDLIEFKQATFSIAAEGAIGAGLYADIWVHRWLALGLQWDYPVDEHRLTSYAKTGLQEESAWHFQELDSPLYQVGVDFSPNTDGLAFAANVNWEQTPTEQGEVSYDPMWSLQVGYQMGF